MSRIAARPVDLFHHHRGFGQAKTGAAVLLRDHRSQPAGFGQRIYKFFRVGAVRTMLAMVFVREGGAERTQGFAYIGVLLKALTFQGWFPFRLVAGKGINFSKDLFGVLT